MHATDSADRIIVIGAGLVGCVLAIYLVRRGFTVTVYERDLNTPQNGRSGRPALSLSLCTRGMRSLDAIGVMPRVRPLLAPAFGRMIHARDGSTNYQRYSVFGEAIHCVSRQALSRTLRDAARARGVEILFGRRCVDLNPASGDVVIEDGGGGRTTARARTIFAADGSSSTVRQLLQRSGWCTFTRTVAHEGYKEFHIRAADAAASGLRSDALHGWPGRHLLAGAFPTTDGSFAGTVHVSLTGPHSFEALCDQSAARLIEAECPALARLAPDLSECLSVQRPNTLASITCDRWSAGKVLLVGDAAHAMLPYYGQGANAGFQDCEILDGLIERHSGNWTRVFLDYERTRKPDVDAMSDLCWEHLSVLRDRAARPDFQLHWEVEQQLHCRFPDAFTPLYSMIAFSSMSYAEARRRDRLQQQVVLELLRDRDMRRRLARPVWSELLRQHVRSRLSTLDHQAGVFSNDRSIRVMEPGRPVHNGCGSHRSREKHTYA